MNDITQGLGKLRSILGIAPSMLAAIDPDRASHKGSGDSWSSKEELGHLNDSAANNHQRIVLGQIDDNIALPGYNQNGWVRAHCYQDQEWLTVIDSWLALNRQLLRAAECAPPSTWAHTLTIGDGEPDRKST